MALCPRDDDVTLSYQPRQRGLHTNMLCILYAKVKLMYKLKLKLVWQSVELPRNARPAADHSDLCSGSSSSHFEISDDYFSSRRAGQFSDTLPVLRVFVCGEESEKARNVDGQPFAGWTAEHVA